MDVQRRRRRSFLGRKGVLFNYGKKKILPGLGGSDEETMGGKDDSRSQHFFSEIDRSKIEKEKR